MGPTRATSDSRSQVAADGHVQPDLAIAIQRGGEVYLQIGEVYLGLGSARLEGGKFGPAIESFTRAAHRSRRRLL